MRTRLSQGKGEKKIVFISLLSKRAVYYILHPNLCVACPKGSNTKILTFFSAFIPFLHFMPTNTKMCFSTDLLRIEIENTWNIFPNFTGNLKYLVFFFCFAFEKNRNWLVTCKTGSALHATLQKTVLWVYFIHLKIVFYLV